jgi:hypothetical protein
MIYSTATADAVHMHKIKAAGLQQVRMAQTAVRTTGCEAATPSAVQLPPPACRQLPPYTVLICPAEINKVFKPFCTAPCTADVCVCVCVC